MAVEADWSSVRSCCKVNEFLQVLSTRRWWRVLGEFENQIEHRSDVLGEVGNVTVERAVIHGEETDLVIFKWYELREVRCADAIEIFRRSVFDARAKAVELRGSKFRFDWAGSRETGTLFRRTQQDDDE